MKVMSLVGKTSSAEAVMPGKSRPGAARHAAPSTSRRVRHVSLLRSPGVTSSSTLSATVLTQALICYFAVLLFYQVCRTTHGQEIRTSRRNGDAPVLGCGG